MVHKKITKSGGITLPRQVRRESGLQPGVPVDVISGKDGVLITRHVPACFNCGSVDEVMEALGIEICKGCAEKVWRCFDDGNRV